MKSPIQIKMILTNNTVDRLPDFFGPVTVSGERKKDSIGKKKSFTIASGTSTYDSRSRTFFSVEPLF